MAATLIKSETSDYDISELGFLPTKCHSTLHENFKCFAVILNKLPETKSTSEQFRQLITELPPYNPLIHNINDLTTPELKFMYSIFTMIMNRYIWCSGVKDAKLYAKLPAILAVPFYQIAEKLQLPMAITHASVDLWNWHLVDEKKGFCLDNIDVNHTMTGVSDEAWFYKIMIAIEGKGGQVLAIISKIINSVQNRPYILYNIDEELNELNDVIVDMNKIISRIDEGCDDSFFFNRLRIYLSGSDNDNLPDGVTLDLEPIRLGHKTIKYLGGSATQSTLIQAIDSFLDIEHEGHGKEFLTKMRNYMPVKHVEYLNSLNKTFSLTSYIEEQNHILTPIASYACKDYYYNALKENYNNCVMSLAEFRKSHLRIVHKYVHRHVNKLSISKDNNAHGSKGSGGTNPISFCKGIIKDTLISSISNSNIMDICWIVLVLVFAFILAYIINKVL